MEERSDQSRGEEEERERRPRPVERRARRHEPERLHRDERREEALPDADERREEDHRPGGMHAIPGAAYQVVTSSSDGDLSAGFGSRPSILSGLSTRSRSSARTLISVFRRGR